MRHSTLNLSVTWPYFSTTRHGGMLRRQDSLLSSSHRETPPPTENHNAKPIGCLSAIFRHFSKFQNRKKLLTFGKKSHKNAVSTQTRTKILLESKGSSTLLKENNHNLNEDDQNLESKRLTRDVMPRSPMLPPEIRLPNDVGSSENTETPRALVARLMGLEEKEEEPDHLQQKKHPTNASGNKIVEKELAISNAEKRKRLLQALEKCNEDLESLKKIIMAVQSADKYRHPSAPHQTCKPRPMSGASVDECSRSPSSHRHSYTKLNSNGVMPQQRKKHFGKKPGEEDGISVSLFNKIQAEALFKMKRKATTAPNFWSSKAMIESVDEVCNDIVWGEKREKRNLGLVLDNYISKDLIEEVVFDLGFQKMQRLPFEACRRRISF